MSKRKVARNTRRFWEVLGPDREVLLYVSVDACGYETAMDALCNLELEDDCYVRGRSMELETK